MRAELEHREGPQASYLRNSHAASGRFSEAVAGSNDSRAAARSTDAPTLALCAKCGKEFTWAQSQSRFDEQGRRVCRQPCTLFPVIVLEKPFRRPEEERWPA